MRHLIDSVHRMPLPGSTLLGSAGAAVLLAIVAAASLAGIASLVSLGGLAIVLGGVTAVAFMSFPAPDVCAALGAILALPHRGQAHAATLRGDMEDIVRWSRIVAEKGTQGLERALAGQRRTDPFVSYGLNLVVSDYGQHDIRAMLDTAAEASHQRAAAPAEILRAMASHAPAFGMVGTLAGMVTMLRGLGSNTDAIGAALAVAFLSTLYGVLSARLIYMPAAARVERQAESLRLRESMITEGMALLACGRSAMFVRDRLNAFLQPQERNYLNIIAGLDAPVRVPERLPAAQGLRMVKG